ncbi:MAG: histidine kinase [Paenibacillaceae bacterium]|nr:histidine kinase [Paenibacillaceae bacterium]
MNVLIKAALHRVEGSLYLAIAALALNIFAYVQNLNVYFAVPLFIFPPIEPFLFLIMISLLMSLRFSNSFKLNERMSLELIKADALKDQFLTRTAHEFKTPLHGMIHMADSLRNDRDNPLTLEQRDKLRLISAAANRLSGLVHDIMDLSKMKQGELSIRLIPLDIRSSVEAVLDMFSYLSAERGIRLVNRIPDDLPLAFADEIRFQQIVSNLLDNACKHAAGGTVEVGTATADGQLEVSVKDTGEGIGEEDLAYIFEPFVTSNPDSGENFGLGLPIVKQLVELQDGRIRVSSTRGQGTVVTFTLPIYSADTKSAEFPGLIVSMVPETVNRPLRSAEEEYTFPTPYVSPRQTAHSVIVVDDHLSNLKVMVDLLERLEYTVIALASGEQALRRLRKGGAMPDLVVLDLMMPGMNGFELCREIRRSFSLFELPVLMVTAAFRTEEKLAAFDAGANDFLTKPFDAAELQARVKGLIELKTSVGKAIGMEAAFLQSQIKPHFLYNVLNTIMALSFTDAEKSRELVSHLADYLRGSFSFRDMQKAAPFGKELELIRHYVDIETARFMERLRVEYEVEEEMLPVKLPPLLIQPLVENAIRHGVGGRKSGGSVRIRAFREGRDAVFEVSDDGVGMTPEQLTAATTAADEPPTQPSGKMSVGMQNIRKRLRYMYGAEMRVQSREGEGTTVTVKVPIGAASGSDARAPIA